MAYRSLLFVPGNRPDRFEKACLTAADFVCIDLEDAVAPGEKARARDEALEWLSSAPHAHAGIRINPSDNAYGAADLAALGASSLALPFVMLPKAKSGKDIQEIAQSLPENLGALFPVIESAKGLCAAGDIYAHPRVKFSIFGAIDYSADIGSDMEWDTLLYARSHLVASARAHDVVLFDTPFGDVRDPQGCGEAMVRAKKIGIFAKSAIHPTQIEVIHGALKPSDAEVSHARRVIRAMDESGGNVALLDGKLLEEPVVKKARRVLTLDE